MELKGPAGEARERTVIDFMRNLKDAKQEKTFLAIE